MQAMKDEALIALQMPNDDEFHDSHCMWNPVAIFIQNSNQRKRELTRNPVHQRRTDFEIRIILSSFLRISEAVHFFYFFCQLR
jgi:hypothetical protein